VELSNTPVDAVALREEVKKKYRDVAIKPNDKYHFHTGRPLAARLGYDTKVVDALPDQAVESFAGVANPFSLRELRANGRLTLARARASTASSPFIK
jgi:arsenite methyltransferase